MALTSRPHVVIVGAGFAGINAAKRLRNQDVDVTVVDRRNHHVFQPLLYQVATAAVDPSDIASPVRTILHAPNVEVALADVVKVWPEERRLELADGSLSYDYLIVATGAEDTYFGHEEWRPHAPGLKSIEDALEIRRRILLAFEEAEREQDAAQRRAWLTFVLIGGGPTGVEMAGALAEVSHHTLKRDFHHIDPTQARVILVEGGPNILPVYQKSLTDEARRDLERLGVEVRTGQRVTGIDAEGVDVGSERIDARTVLWSAGVTGSGLGKSLGAPLDKMGRVKVSADLSVPGHPEVFVAGDLAFVEQEGKQVPGLAPAALQMGDHVAQQILRSVRKEATQPFHYWDKGSFAVIGRGKAVGVVGKRAPLKGFIAWFAWLSIHLFFLIGFRNRFLVMLKWAYSYLTMRRGSRLITGPQRRPPEAKSQAPTVAADVSPARSAESVRSSGEVHAGR